MEELTCSQMENICGGMKQGENTDGDAGGGASGVCWEAVGWGLLTIGAGVFGQIGFGTGFAIAGIQALHECYG